MLLLAVSLGLGQLQNRAREAGETDALTRVARAMVASGSATIDNTSRYLEDKSAALSQGSQLRAEIERLRQVEAAASLYNQAIAGLQRELDQLRALHQLPNYGRKKVMARIIGSFPIQNRMTLSVGSKHGVGKGMPVVTAQGLIGLVQNVDKETCQVLLACSPAIKFGAMVDRSPEVPGLMKGQTPSRMVLDVLDNGVVEVGDSVVTSGLSELIPRGIQVGIVAEVVPDPSYGTRRVFVAPAAQIGPSLEVAVLK